jgi:glutamate-1-semialdehyde 2,1-aminomutase
MEAQLAQIVCERFPAIEKVRFVNSGTEANMIAIGTALIHTGKSKILVFKKGYHGSTISSHSADGKPSLNLPHDFVSAPYNDVPATRAILDALPKDSLAAILVEPMLGSGGCFAGKLEFLQLLRAEATRHKALLIFDEVMASRLSYHGYSDKIGIRPDLMTIGKWVGGGMSFGAFGGRDDIMNIFDPRLGKVEHAGTFNNNVMSMSAGIAGCTLLDEQRIDDLNSRGERMRRAIEAQLADWGVTG